MHAHGAVAIADFALMTDGQARSDGLDSLPSRQVRYERARLTLRMRPRWSCANACVAANSQRIVTSAFGLHARHLSKTRGAPIASSDQLVNFAGVGVRQGPNVDTPRITRTGHITLLPSKNQL